MKSLIAALALFACFQFDAQAMGVIRRLTNEVPPVVITNAPPVVTNSQPVVDVPAFPQSWNVTEIKRWDAKWKVMGVHVVPRGLLVSRYDRNSRVESKIEELSGWAWRTVWSGDEETIGGGTVSGNDLYFAAERGSTFIVYDQATGKTRRGDKVPDGYKWNVFTHAWRDTVAVGADGPDKTASVFDACTGRKLFQSALDGLIAGMTVDDDGVLWLAVSDGQQGVCNSAGWFNREIKPSSICFVPGLGIVAGSQVDGVLKRWTGTGWTTIADLDCSKINRMTFDASRGLLLVSGAKPDTFATLKPRTLALERVARFNDEAKDRTGEQFDTDINTLPDGRLILARANGSGCYVYEASPSTTPKPPEEPPAPTSFDPAKAKWIKGSDPRGWPAVADLKVYWGMSGNKRGLYMEIGPELKGKDCTAMVLIQRDVLYAGSWDDIGDSPGRKFKQATNLGYKNSKGGPYIAGDDPALRKFLMPKDREGIAIMCACRDTKQTTRPTVLLWTPEK